MAKVLSSGIIVGIKDNKDAGISEVMTGDGMAFEATSIREDITAGSGVAQDTSTIVATKLRTAGEASGATCWGRMTSGLENAGAQHD